MTTTIKRFSSIDDMKVIAAFLVICIHIPFPGTFGDVTSMLGRIAVPFFFIASGFFANENLDKIKSSFLKLLKLILLANLLYFVWYCFVTFITTENISSYFKSIFNLTNFLKVIFLNFSPVSEHLWYLNAYLYVLIFYYIAVKYKIIEKLYWFIPILLLGDLVLGAYSKLLFGVEIPYIIVRNFIFVGIPYFLLGDYLSKKGEQIIHLLKISNGKLALLILFTVVVNLFERYALIHFNLHGVREHYFSTTLLVLNVFIFLIKNNDLFKNHLLSDIGKKYSTYIYIVHMLVIDVYRVVLGKSNIDLLNYIAPLVVVIISLLISVLYTKVKTVNRQTF